MRNFVEGGCIIPNPLDSLYFFLFRTALFRTFPRQLLHRKRCYQPVLRQQHVCARHLSGCPLPRRCQQKPSRPLPSFHSLQTAPRRGRRTRACAQRVSQVRASSRPSWSCSPTRSARWSLLRTSLSASFTAARLSVTVVSQTKRTRQSPDAEILIEEPFVLPPFFLYVGAGPLGHPKIYINLVRLKRAIWDDCSPISWIGQTWSSSVRVS